MWTEMLLFTLLGLAIVAVLVNIRSMKDELTEVVSYDPENPAGSPGAGSSIYGNAGHSA